MERHWGERKSPKKAGTSNTEKHITVQDNKIYYYSGVTRESCSELNKKIGELEGKYLGTAQSLGIDPPTIKLMINSGGGSVVS